MTNIMVADVTVHIDESLDKAARTRLLDDIRSQEGVVSVQPSASAPHLIIVKYDSAHSTARNILKVVLGEHLHAELIGGI